MSAAGAVAAVAWLAPILLPLLLAPLALLPGRRVGGLRAWLPVLAPVPALVLAVAGAPGPPPELPWILLDLRLALDPVAQLLLVLTGTVWLAAGVAARPVTSEHGGFAALWLVTLAGSVGVVLAGDVVSLYTLYAAMTFAAYGLIVHDRTAEVRRAGRVYVVLAVVGEALLLSGLVLAVGAAGSLALPDLAAALGGSGAAAGDGGLAGGAGGGVTVAGGGGVTVAGGGGSGLIVGLLATGFAVKAGIMPLHVWLPLAHPAAPVAASAVLSGALIKAGLIGWLRLLPLGGAAWPGWGTVFVVVGLTTAIAGALIGVAQTRPKVVLAYSSVSQMGIIATLVGVGLLAPAAAPAAVLAAAVTAFHHGLAKGALFLGVGVHARTLGARGRQLVVVGTAVAGAALAGAPLTSGFVAKSAGKDAVEALPAPWDGRITFALSLAAVATTFVMARVLVLLARADAAERSRPAPRRAGVAPALVVGWLALLAATLLATWVVPAWLLDVAAPSVTVTSVAEAVWPVAVGVAIAGGVVWWRRGARRDATPRWQVPAGDLVVVAEAWLPTVAQIIGRAVATLRVVRRRAVAGVVDLQRVARPGEGFARLDRWLTRWQSAGVLLVLLAVGLFVTLAQG